RRRVRAVLRHLQPEARYAGARQRALRDRLDDLLRARDRCVQRRRECEVPGRPDDRDLDDADLLPLDLPDGAEAALQPSERASTVRAPVRDARTLVVGDPRYGPDPGWL